MTTQTPGVTRPYTFAGIPNFNVDSKKSGVAKDCIGIGNIDENMVLNLRTEQQKSTQKLVADLLKVLSGCRAVNEGNANHAATFTANTSPANAQVTDSQPNILVARQLDRALDSLPSSVQFISEKKAAAFQDLLNDVKNKYILKNNQPSFNNFVAMLSKDESHPRALDCVNDFLMMRKEIKDSSPPLNEDKKSLLNKLTENFIQTVAKDGLGADSYAAGSSKKNGSGTQALNKFNNICNQLARMKPGEGQSTLSFNPELADKFKIALSKIDPPAVREKLMQQAQDFIFRPSLKEHGMIHTTIQTEHLGLGPFYSKQIQLGHEARILDLLKNKLLDSVDPKPPGPQRPPEPALAPINLTLHLDNSFHWHNSPYTNRQGERLDRGSQHAVDRNEPTVNLSDLPGSTAVKSPMFMQTAAIQTDSGQGIDQGTQQQPVQVNSTGGQDETDKGTVKYQQNLRYENDLQQSHLVPDSSRGLTSAKTAEGILIADAVEMSDTQDALRTGRPLKYAALVSADNTALQPEQGQRLQVSASNDEPTGAIPGESPDRWGKRSYAQLQKDNVTYIGSPGSAQAADNFAEVGKKLHLKPRGTSEIVNRQGNLYQGMPRLFGVPAQDAYSGRS